MEQKDAKLIWNDVPFTLESNIRVWRMCPLRLRQSLKPAHKKYIVVHNYVNPLTPNGHYNGFVIKFIIKIITRTCLVLWTWNKNQSILHEIAFKTI